MVVHPGESRSGSVTTRSSSPSGPAEISPSFDELQKRLGLRFRNPALLRQAMTHASWNNERGAVGKPGEDNERLEYLGDAVLELVTGEYLYKRFPGDDEGRLTQLRSALVNTVSLSQLARKLQLGDTLMLGKGAEKHGARELPSLLANAFEAMIGAVFLDSGYEAAARIFIDNIGDVEEWVDANYKGKLQEAAQERFHETPSYQVTAVSGGSRREYRATAIVGGKTLAEGQGQTKQAAEQAAAEAALEKLAKMAPQPAVRARDRDRGGETSPRRGGQRRSRPPRHQEPPPSAGGIVGGLRSVARSILTLGKPPPEPEPPKRAKSNSRRRRSGGRGPRVTPHD